MSSHTYRVKGMHCASCASIIERTLKGADGVSSAEVSYAAERAKVAFDPGKTDHMALSKMVEPLGYSLEPSAAEMGMSADEHAAHLGLSQSKAEKLAEIREMKRRALIAAPMAVFSIIVMAWDALAAAGYVAAPLEALEELFHHLLPVMATYVMFAIGTPYLLGVYRFIRHGAANMDTLIGIGTLAAYLYSFAVSAFEGPLGPYLDVEHTYYDVTIVVIAFIVFGKYLEARSKLRTGDAIEELLNLQAKTALLVRDGAEVEVPAAEVVRGDIVIVKPGAKIPVDGTIINGSSFIDESMVTGEPMPVGRGPGEAVIAGTINTSGSFTFSAEKVGADTLLAHIVRMVEEAQASRAPIQALADRISAVFVPAVLLIATASLAGWLLLASSSLGFAEALSFGLTSFVGVLVIACPCALGLATPTAIIVGVGKGAREGILVKDAATLERLHEVDAVVVDKTGTITEGRPKLVSIEPQSSLDEKGILSILAALESRSEHPIADAIMVRARADGVSPPEASAFSSLKGKGVRGTVGGIEYFAGNAALVADLGLSFDGRRIEEETRKGRTPIILATKKEVLGVALVADSVKPEAKKAVEDLRRLGVSVVMLTGDDQNTARAIADEAGIEEVFAEALPETKLQKIRDLQAGGRVVAMAGDGVNDAPALAQADVGVAMGTGTDAAIEAAGITLLHGDISKLPRAVRLSRLTMRGIRQNLFWAFAYNVVGIPLASGILYPLFGWLLSPAFAGLAMALSSVSVVGNSLRLKAKKI